MYIFPLQLVLVPGEMVPLNIFEVRYIELMKSCISEDKPFGIVRLMAGRDTDQKVEFETVGCSARITNWDMPRMGRYHIEVVGEKPFKITEARILENGLTDVKVQWLEDVLGANSSKDVKIGKYLLKEIYKKLHDNSQEIEFEIEGKTPGWVSYRLVELILSEPEHKQEFLEERDDSKRIARAINYLGMI